MQHLNARLVQEHFHGQMRQAATAAGGVVEGLGLRLGLGDQLLHRADLGIGVRHQQQRRGGQHGDGREVLVGFEAVFLQQGGVDELGHAEKQQRVAVSRRAGHKVQAQHAGGSRAVFHHQRLLPVFRSNLREDATGKVGAGTGGGGNDPANVFVGVGSCTLRQRQAGCEGRKRRGACQQGRTAVHRCHFGKPFY